MASTESRREREGDTTVDVVFVGTRRLPTPAAAVPLTESKPVCWLSLHPLFLPLSSLLAFFGFALTPCSKVVSRVLIDHDHAAVENAGR